MAALISDRLGSCRDIQIRDVADAGNLALPTHSENAYCFRGFAGHQKMPMWKLSATTKATRAILFAALASLFASPPLSSMAEQSAGQQSTVSAPAGALMAERPVQPLPLRVSSRRPFVRTKAAIQVRCTVIIGGATVAMFAISRTIMSWFRRNIATNSPNYTTIAAVGRK